MLLIPHLHNLLIEKRFVDSTEISCKTTKIKKSNQMHFVIVPVTIVIIVLINLLVHPIQNVFGYLEIEKYFCNFTIISILI